MSDPREIFLKCRELFKEDPDNIRAKRELKKREDDKRRQMLVAKIHDRKESLINLAKGREAIAQKRSQQYKPKTVPGSK